MNKVKNIHPVPRPLTQEEQAQRLAAFIAQKKEQLFQGCLFSLLSNPSFFPTDTEVVIKRAEKLADSALFKMYPNIKKDE